MTDLSCGGQIVIVKRDGTDGSSYPLVGGTLSVGSGKECDIRIRTESVARKHCVIEFKNGQAGIRSSSVRAPVVVNNRRVTDKLLNHGDVISIDGAKFRWDRESSALLNARKTNGIRLCDSNGKRRRTETIEKLENPTVLDKNKRAAFVLMTARSPGNRDNSRNTSNVNFKNISPRKKALQQDITPKTYADNSKPNTVCAKSSTIRESRLKMAHSETKIASASIAKSTIVTRHSRIPRKISKILSNSRNEKSKRKSVSKNQTISSQSNYTENSPLGICRRLANTRSKLMDSKDTFNISGVEAIADSESRTPPNIRPRVSMSSVLKEINIQSTRSGSKINSPATDDHISPTPIKSLKRTSQKSKRNSSSILHNPDSNQSADKSKSNEIMLVSFISSIANALKIVDNHPDATIDVEAVLKTPEFYALNNQIKSAGKTLDFAIIDSPCPQILEIGSTIDSNENKNKRGSRSYNGTYKSIHSSPIISPKQGIYSNISDVSLDENTDNIISTPNLSKVFAVDASTPLEIRKSVQNRIEQFESMANVNKNESPMRKSSRMSNLINRNIFERKIQFERGNTEPRSRNQKGSRIKDRKSLTIAALKTLNTRSQNSISPEASVPNDIVITPKSTIKPIPEILKEKHSTAKKPISKKSIIDHLTQSPEVVKELFKSPVKRKLSRSMNQYNSSKIFDDSPEICPFNITGEGVPVLSQSIGKLAKINLNQKSAIIESWNAGGKKRLLTTPKPNKSPENDLRDVRGVKRLLATPKFKKSPKNDLRDVRGVKRLLATPKFKKSPKNDLRDVRGVKRLLVTPKPNKSPKNDLRDVRGVKRLLKTPKLNKSPKNDLRNVQGVKKLLATPKPKNSPKNDLRDVRGVKKLLSTPKLNKSPENDLRDVRGIKKLLATPKKNKSPRNDLRSVKGLRKLLATPKALRSPKNNLSNVLGVKNLFNQKSPNNDLEDVEGVKSLLQTPKTRGSKRVSGNNLTFADDIVQLFATKTPQKSLKDEHLNARVNTPLKCDTNKTNSPGKNRSMSFDNKSAILFDSLVGKSPQKTYSNSKRKASNSDQNKSDTENQPICLAKNESDIIQDMKSAFMKYEANVSSEFLSPNKSLVKHTAISRQPQSTPIVETKVTKTSRKNVRPKPEIQLAQRVTRSRVTKPKSPVKVIPKQPKKKTEETDAIIKSSNVESPKRLRSQKSSLRKVKDETELLNKLTAASKKKVSFATKVKLMGDENSTVVQTKSSRLATVSKKNNTKELKNGSKAKTVKIGTKTASKNTVKKVSSASSSAKGTKQKSTRSSSSMINSTAIKEIVPIPKRTRRKLDDDTDKCESKTPVANVRRSKRKH